MCRVIAALILIFSLAACGGETEAKTAEPSSSSPTTSEAPPEGDEQEMSSVADAGGASAMFGDGLKVTIVSLAQPDPAVFRAQKDGEQPLVLTTRWENVGTAPVELAGYDNVRASLLSGPNGFTADTYAVGGDGTSLPARVAPGAPFDYLIYYSVPDTSALTLVFNPNPDAFQDFTFTDVEQLIG